MSTKNYQTFVYLNIKNIQKVFFMFKYQLIFTVITVDTLLKQTSSYCVLSVDFTSSLYLILGEFDASIRYVALSGAWFLKTVAAPFNHGIDSSIKIYISNAIVSNHSVCFCQTDIQITSLLGLLIKFNYSRVKGFSSIWCWA